VSKTGGSGASGGAPATGGAPNSGGIPRTGGSSASGGVTNSGGVPNAGGSSAPGGGATGTGGSLPWLTVVGNQLQDPSGKRVILRGVSLQGISGQTSSKLGMQGILDRITNKSEVTAASTETPGSPGWYTRIVRLPVDPPANGGTITDTYVNTILKPAVDYATSRGLYAAIDLHYISNPYTLATTVNNFWAKIAPMFKDYPNVFYEPFNESSQTDSWATYKPTMQGWVNTIRSAAPKNIILAGSPSWDQSLGDTATNPLTGGNIVYVVHMYWAHWTGGKQTTGPNNTWNQKQVEACAKANPVIMTEWGFSDEPTQQADPDIISHYGKPMLTWLEALGGSWTAWCADDDWLPRMFTSNGGSATWTLLSGPRQMGAFVKDWMYTNKDSN
jgi:hypothetical protein